MPTVENLKTLCVFYGISADEMLGITPSHDSENGPEIDHTHLDRETLDSKQNSISGQMSAVADSPFSSFFAGLSQEERQSVLRTLFALD